MEFLLVLFIFPILVVGASIAGYIILKKWYVVPLAVFGFFLMLTLILFNTTFFFWVFVYTALALLVSLIMKFTIQLLV
ncbi:YbeF family protein [Ectobacillus sp. JY-23]|uniref:DUF2651 family protein n=1 Tax=Ectobacillus sp. JY-23 TaxID=2933872 RepID=UPI001FF668DB|nr:DUF2651 family protein [Ectobacillus sp. JY-23]UOY93103.1 YbeF family protein [Ectobacillus sp. JY-23]